MAVRIPLLRSMANPMRKPEFNIVAYIGPILFLCMSVVAKEFSSPDMNAPPEDIISQAFIYEISNFSEMCKAMNITEANFKERLKAVFVTLAKSTNNKYQPYLVANTTRRESPLIIQKFLAEQPKHKEKLDYVSSFLARSILLLQGPISFDKDIDEEEYDVKEEAKYNKLKNFCMNAMASLRSKPGLPPLFEDTEKWMPGRFWEMQGWHNAYRVAPIMPTEAAVWWWVNASIKLLKRVGGTLDRHFVEVYTELGRIYDHKLLGSSDDPYNNFYAIKFAAEYQSYLAQLEPSILAAINKKYPGLDWKSPLSFGIYWYEFGLYKTKQESYRLTSRLLHCLHINAMQGRVFLIQDSGNVIRLFHGPNFELHDIIFDIYERRLAVVGDQDVRGKKRESLHARMVMEACLLRCYIYNRQKTGNRLYERLKQTFPARTATHASFKEYTHEVFKRELFKMEAEGVNGTLYTCWNRAYVNIAMGQTQDGKALLEHAERVLDAVMPLGFYYKMDIKAMRKNVYDTLLDELPNKHAEALSRWIQNNPQN